MKRTHYSLGSTLYDFIVETLLKTRTAERGWAALQEPPRCIDAHTLEFIPCAKKPQKRKKTFVISALLPLASLTTLQHSFERRRR